ncbi:MAG TPA: small ribosomal subunit Rsm22 family protein [Rhizomicrobium sp.]|nr:small ribosomal subunit Rsm22 family protein [Rhizomicrobium sp.]
MDFSLPPALVAALDAALEGVSRNDLAARAAAQTATFRGGGTSRPITSQLDALAYGLARMPATFAANAAVFARLAEAMPDFAPASLLDVGAGPGTASWAAASRWPSVKMVTMVDHNPALRALARRLADSEPMLTADIVAGDAGKDGAHADLVVASYVLAEMAEADAVRTARDLWPRAEQALVLIEPGTPAGFRRIRAARAALIEAGAHVAAPCTHDNACPMAGSVGASRSDNQISVGASRSDNQISDWCHFSQRLPRRRDHMQLKAATVPFEDERYSYVALTRDVPPPRTARILSPPLEEKPGLAFELCDKGGRSGRFVPVRDRDEIRRVRRKGWGDLF